MLKSKPRSWLLDGRTGWRTGPDPVVTTETFLTGAGVATRQVVSDHGTLKLIADIDGPLSLTFGGPYSTLGGLTLPRGFAFDRAWTLHLLNLRTTTVDRFEPETRQFVPLPAIGGRGGESWQFRNPRSIAIAGQFLYVLDSGDGPASARLVAYDLSTLVLMHEWRTDSDLPSAPVDIAGRGNTLNVLTETGEILRTVPGVDFLTSAAPPVEQDAAVWTRIAVDKDENVYLFDERSMRLAQVSLTGKILGWHRDASELRSSFEPIPFHIDRRGVFCLPPSVTRACDRRPRDAARGPESSSQLPTADSGCAAVYDANGQPVEQAPVESLRDAVYVPSGIWYSSALDSRTARCQWHRIEVGIRKLPLGSGVTIQTCTSDTLLDDASIQQRAVELWDPGLVRKAVWVRPSATESTSPENDDFLIQSQPGRYLWLRVELNGDRLDTPEIDFVRVHFPRESYLHYLPAVFSEDEENRRFLERFLSIFQTEWDSLEQTVADRHRYTSLTGVPNGQFLSYLASWLGLPLEGSWDEDQKRALLRAAPDIYPIRGTIEGLRKYVSIYLQNINDLGPDELHDFPMFIEGYRERNHPTLGDAGGTSLGAGRSLWSRDVTGRLQLGVNARADEGRLIGAGAAELDIFEHYAHRFRVFIPSAWVVTDDAEALVRKALDEEKPAHTQYELCLFESKFQIGMQSTLGFDTVIGDLPTIHLGAAGDGCATSGNRAGNRLGHDTILSCPDDGRSVSRLSPGVRLGASAPRWA